MEIRAFLSHSSVDKGIVVPVYEGLADYSAWLDIVELELGAVLIEKIASAIERSSDFVLFWSEAASRSPWVNHELNMALIQRLRTNAIRLRVVRLDGTPVPLQLAPFRFLDVAEATDKVAAILPVLRKALQEPAGPVRRQFLDRNEELGRLERAIDDRSISVVAVYGFQGIGKRALVHEAVRRYFVGSQQVVVDVTRGTGTLELLLQL